MSADAHMAWCPAYNGGAVCSCRATANDPPESGVVHRTARVGTGEPRGVRGETQGEQDARLRKQYPKMGGHSSGEPRKRCAACGEPFEPSEARHYFGPIEHWIDKQRLGPVHGRCQLALGAARESNDERGQRDVLDAILAEVARRDAGGRPYMIFADDDRMGWAIADAAGAIREAIRLKAGGAS